MLRKISIILLVFLLLAPSYASASITKPIPNKNNGLTTEKKMLKPTEVTANIDEYGEVELKWDAKKGTEYIVKKTDKKGNTQTLAKTKSGRVVDICKHKGVYKYSVLPMLGTMPASAATIRYLNVGSVKGDFDLKIKKRQIKIVGKSTKDADGYEVVANGEKTIIHEPKFKAKGEMETTVQYKIRAFRKDEETGKRLYTDGITRYVYISDFDAEEALKYARKYAIDYNPDFHDYNPQGGDCANFVSQCLSAGGLKQTDEWNYTNGKGTSAWISCRSMYALFSKKYEVIEYPTYEDFDKGDIVMKRSLTHVVICSGKDENGKPLICAHNDKHCDDPLYGDISNWLIIKPTQSTSNKEEN